MSQVRKRLTKLEQENEQLRNKEREITASLSDKNREFEGLTEECVLLQVLSHQIHNLNIV